MAKRRRKIKRSPPPWKSAIGVSVGVHAFIIMCVVGIGWRYLHDAAPGLPIAIHEVFMGDGEAGNESAPAAPTPHAPQAMGSHSNERTAQVSTPSPQPSTEGEGESTLTQGNSGNPSGNGTNVGTGPSGAGDPTLAEIRRRIEAAKRYPAQARSMHQEGRVGVHFKIRSNGQIAEIHVSQSSGTPALDDAAVQAVQRSAPLPTYSHSIDLSLAFRLR